MVPTTTATATNEERTHMEDSFVNRDEPWVSASSPKGLGSRSVRTRSNMTAANQDCLKCLCLSHLIDLLCVLYWVCYDPRNTSKLTFSIWPSQSPSHRVSPWEPLQPVWRRPKFGPGV